MNVENFVYDQLYGRDSLGVWTLAVEFLDELTGNSTEDDDIEILEAATAHFKKKIDNYDPTPVEQWEVTEGTSARERHETMIRNLP